MMQLKSAAEALSDYLAATPEQPPERGELIDRLGQTLFSAGNDGMPFSDAMTQAKLSRNEFLTVLPTVTSAGLAEIITDAGQQKLRLTAAGKSLY